MFDNRKKIKGVIFDLDETLIDSLVSFTGAFNAGIKIFGLNPVPEKRVAHFLDKGLKLSEILAKMSKPIETNSFFPVKFYYEFEKNCNN